MVCSSLHSAQQQKQGAVGVLLVADMDLFWEAVSLGRWEQRKGCLTVNKLLYYRPT